MAQDFAAGRVKALRESQANAAKYHKGMMHGYETQAAA